MDYCFPARTPLNVIIVGAGIGGVAAALTLGQHGHQVILVETASELTEIGAGIQVPPNMFRLLNRMGVGTEVRSRSVVLEHIRVLRWQDGQVLQNAKMTTHPQREHLVIHRADLHNILVKAVLRLPNVDLRVNSTVVDFDFECAAITLLDGSVITGDLVLAADGIKSTARRKLLSVSGEHDAIEPTGDSAYRVILTREQMIDDPELKELIDDPSVSRWLGPGRHIVGYPIRNHSLYNIVLIHPDHGDQGEVWTTEVTKEDMCRDYEGWDNRIQKLIDRVDQSNILQWRLYLHKPLPTWLKGTTALLGDACHPMLPYIAQGAAQAVEDAASLGCVLSQISDRSQIPQALEIYEQSRKTRVEIIQRLGTLNRLQLHLPDGSDQIVRDRKLREADKPGRRSPDKWVDAPTQDFLCEWDAPKMVQHAWSLTDPYLGHVTANL